MLPELGEDATRCGICEAVAAARHLTEGACSSADVPSLADLGYEWAKLDVAHMMCLEEGEFIGRWLAARFAKG